MSSTDFKIRDLVWAKMKGYPQWPAQIVEPIASIKAPKNKKTQFVYFFGTRNYAWIRQENIIPHSESVFDTLIQKRSKTYQCAIDELRQELESSSASMPVAKNDDFNGESCAKSSIDVDDNSISSSDSIDPLIYSDKINVENKRRATKVVKILFNSKKKGRQVAHKPLKKKPKGSNIDGKSSPCKKAYKENTK